MDGIEIGIAIIGLLPFILILFVTICSIQNIMEEKRANLRRSDTIRKGNATGRG